MQTASLQPVQDASVWRGSDLEADRSWEHRLSADQAAELETALASVKERGLQLTDISPDAFPLPGLAELMSRIGDELRTGRGFVLLRGFPVAEHENSDLELMYYGLCRHLGMAMTQNSDGGLIHYVYDGALRPNQGTRGVGFPKVSKLHVDLTDIVSLLCVRQAPDEPRSRVASSAAVFNELLVRRPDLEPRLREGFEWDRMDEHGPDEDPSSGYRVPLFSARDGKLSCRYNRHWIISANARRQQPVPVEDEAMMDLIDEIAEEVSLAFPFQKGDIQFCSNYTVLHGREAHAVETEDARKRLLMRIWLNVPDFRAFADEAVVRYGIGYHGNLGWTAEDVRAGRMGQPRARREDGAIQLSG